MGIQTFQTLPDAIALAHFGHRNQLDKAGLPYVDHPLRVLAGVQAQGGRPYVQIAAVLHDLTEDTKFTLQMLLDLGFSPAAVNLIRLVDKNTYTDENGKMDKVAYYAGIRANPDATMIKIADIRDNTAPWRLSYLPDETQARLIKKYEDAMSAITGTVARFVVDSRPASL